MNTSCINNGISNSSNEYQNNDGGWIKEPPKEELGIVFKLCRNNDWEKVLARVMEDPALAVQLIVMDNHINTTIIHQAITSKGDIQQRAGVISTILTQIPRAAALKNGYGSLPLHVISQRNTKMDAKTKERLIQELVQAYPEAIVEAGGVGKRTPLHIIFTDYVSPHLTKTLIENGNEACFMKDKKGFLPAHVACSRHCSPEKLRMLLGVNPDAIFEETNQGHSLLDLAKSTATKSHPNYALIAELERQLASHPNNSAERNEFGNLSSWGAPYPAQNQWSHMRTSWEDTTYRENHGMPYMANTAHMPMNSGYHNGLEMRHVPMTQNMVYHEDRYPEYAPDFFKNTPFADPVVSNPTESCIVESVTVENSIEDTSIDDSVPLQCVPSEPAFERAGKRKLEDDDETDYDDFSPANNGHHKRIKSSCSEGSFSSYNQAADLLLNFSRGPTTQSSPSTSEECPSEFTPI